MLVRGGSAAGTEGIYPETGQDTVHGQYLYRRRVRTFFAVIGVIIVIRQLSRGVGKQVKQYLMTHPDATMEQLDSDYESAKRYGNIWIGSRWTFSYDINGLILENTDIAWVFSEAESGRRPRYFLCLGMVDGNILRTSVESDQLLQLKERYAQFPHILMENIAQYEPLFKNNLNGFLDIQYNRSRK